jgi:hypothetical protein
MVSGYSRNDATWVIHKLSQLGRAVPNLLPQLAVRPHPIPGGKDKLGLRAIAEQAAEEAHLDHIDVLRKIAPRIAAEWDAFEQLNAHPRAGEAPRSQAAMERVFSGLRKVVRVLYEGSGQDARHYLSGRPLGPLVDLTLLDLVWYNTVRGRALPVNDVVVDLLPPELRAISTPEAQIPALWPIIRDGLQRLGAAIDTVVNAHDSIVSILLRLYKDALPAGSAARARFDVVVTTKIITEELKETGALDIELDIEELLRRIQWHEIVAFVLPRLAREAREERSRWKAAIAKAKERGHSQPMAHRVARESYGAYSTALRRYLALAIPAALPLRKGNFAHGRWGLGEGEWRLELEGPLNDPQAVKCLIGSFTSRAVDRSKLKGHFNKREKKLLQRVSPAIVDYEILFSYLRDVRAPELMARGVSLEPTDPLGLSKPTPLFLQRNSLAGSEDVWARNFRRALISGISMLRPNTANLPPNKARGLLSIHRVRALFSTHWFGVVGDRAPGGLMTGKQIAAHFTTDTPQTLYAHYVRVMPTMTSLAAKMAPQDQWENPRIFIDLMYRALLEARPIEWEKIDMPRPPRNGTAIKALRVPMRRIARARPGQRIV